jgi:aryl-alcohol dehydrogenase-like predicted oxidoreductase
MEANSDGCGRGPLSTGRQKHFTDRVRRDATRRRRVFGPPGDRDKALAVLRAGLEAGVDHIDTAQFYGPGVVNVLIREALYPYPTS